MSRIYSKFNLKQISQVLLVVGFLFFVNGCQSDGSKAQYDQNFQETLDIALVNALEKYNAVGATIAVKRPDDGLTYKSAQGYSIDELKTPMSLDHNFRIGSVTKTFTSTMILMLVDRGLITLDTTIEEILPDLDIVMDDVITIKNLLEMRSGLEKYLANEDITDYLLYNTGNVWTPLGIISYGDFQVSIPGTDFLYNNTNYVILGLIIEEVTGKSYDESLDELILEPLKLHNTFMPHNDNLPEPAANGYIYSEDADMVLNYTHYLHPTFAWSAGGLISNIHDLSIWADAYLNGTLLSENSHAQQFDLQYVSEEENPVIEYYGFGTMRSDGILVGHDGYIPPYGSWVAEYNGYKFAFLNNGSRDNTIQQVFLASAILIDIIEELDL